MKPMKNAYRQGETLGTVEKIPNKYELITNKIIEALESGTVPWKKPWTAINPQNMSTRKEYRGINTILLSMVPTKYPVFATFNQIKAAGGTVLKGSKSVPVFFMSPITKNQGTEEEEKYFLLKQYALFTMEQVDGIDLSQFIDPVQDFTPAMEAENLIQAYLKAENLEIKGAQQAYYSPSHDFIGCPDPKQFHSRDAYYSTLFHEIIHSTRHAKRTNRESLQPGYKHEFGNKNYAFEELIAELGAAMLATYCGVDTSLEEGQNAAYIKSWLKTLKDDSKMVYKAASKAQQAVDYILKVSGFNAFETNEEEQKDEQ